MLSRYQLIYFSFSLRALVAYGLRYVLLYLAPPPTFQTYLILL